MEHKKIDTLILSGIAAMICSARVKTRDSSSEGNASSEVVSGWPKKQSVGKKIRVDSWNSFLVFQIHHHVHDK